MSTDTIVEHNENDGVDAAPRLATLHVVGEPTGLYVRRVKPAFDRVAGTMLLVLVLPVMAACAIAVRISLGRGIFFSQDRVGLGGRVFTIYKFRTMEYDRRGCTGSYVGPERRLTHKHPQDPRITGLGRFLRKWSLDELPQLFNVARGDMSIVGPRPEIQEIVARYSDWEHARHKVKPGLTGLWQVSVRGSGQPMHEHVAVDLQYVARISAGQDLWILLRTPVSLITNRGI